MINWKHKSKALTIVTGEPQAEDNLKLPAGKCVGIAVVPFGTDPATPVQISIKDGGNEVVETMNYKFLQKTNGGRFVDSFMPVSFKCDRNLDITLSTTANVAADFGLEVLFLIQQDENIYS
ncbi:hypothetical protein [Flagellimonas marina]|uniref:Uncharacterized protein n=1 Tax=Flagellimonas marina TaxID=1775168 RepID=A0ABV8PJE3_9FLAO